MKYLKTIRLLAALVIFVPILLFFLDFTGKLPLKLHVLLSMQWVPALLSLNFVLLGFLLLLSVLFGRIYCSVICPLGVYQDIIARIAGWFRKKKSKRMSYRKADTMLRYALLGVVVLVFVTGSSFLLLLFDPYSIFGRIVSQIFQYPIVAGNNLLATVLNHAGNYSVYPVEQNPFIWLVFVVTAAFWGIVTVMAAFLGRRYCNMICPVGTFLGLISKVSVFRLTFDNSACNRCGACERKCKSQCIESGSMKIDDSRCVSCFNCVSVCKKGAMKYNFRYKMEGPKTTVSATDQSRRTFLLVSGAVVAGAAFAGPKKMLRSRDSILDRKPVMPPGAMNQQHFHRHCTGCQLCVSKCPMGVLKPAVMQYGLTGITQPHMTFSTHVFCTYECTICSDVCPTGALRKMPLEEKKLTQVGIAKLRLNMCEVIVKGTDCGACSEHCPTQAVHMVPYKNGLTRPEVNDALCIGCGGCESICPVKPYQAIYVEGVDEQGKAKKPEEAKKFDKKIDDFGF